MKVTDTSKKGPWKSRLRPSAGVLAVLILASSGSVALSQDSDAGLSEEYQDWRLQCIDIENAARSCALRQEQSRQNGERLLTVELSQRPDGFMRGTILLPFGILFDRGVTLQIDDNASREPLAFRTCLPSGCIVTFDVDQTMLSQMRTGTKIDAQIVTVNGQEMTFPISLSGLTSATNRLSALTGL